MLIDTAEKKKTYMNEYDENKRGKNLICLDSNNLYGHIILEFVPTSRFIWFTDVDIENVDVGKILSKPNYE